MLVTIYILVMLLLLFFCFIGFMSDDSDFGAMAFFVFLATWAMFLVPVCFHNHDLSTLQNSKEIIDISESAIIRIDEEIKSVTGKDSVPTALMNHDTPIKALVDSKTVYVQELLLAKKKVLEAKMSIQRRNRGFTKYAIWILGDK